MNFAEIAYQSGVSIPTAAWTPHKVAHDAGDDVPGAQHSSAARALRRQWLRCGEEPACPIQRARRYAVTHASSTESA